MKNVKKLSAVVLLAAGLVSTAQALPSYTITNLSGLGGNYAAAYGINDLGQIVGTGCVGTCSATSPNTNYRAALWDSGSATATNLGFVGVARAINNLGEVVGETGTGFTRPQFPNGRAFYWNNTYASGTYKDLGTHYENGSGGYYGYSGAFDINDAGQITGFAYTEASYPDGPAAPGISVKSQGFVADRNNGFVMQNMGCVDSNYDCYSRGQGLNESGQIAGRSTDTDFDGNKQGTYWDWNNDGPVPQFMQSGTQAYSTMEDINEAGLMVGVSSDDPQGQNLQATTWSLLSGGGYSSSILANAAGYNTSYAWAVNDAGKIVGYMQGGALATRRAFINTADGMSNLNDLVIGGVGSQGFSYLEVAYDINSSGQIVGVGKMTNGSFGAFLLTPEVPVPAAAWMMGSALVGLMGIARKRKK